MARKMAVYHDGERHYWQDRMREKRAAARVEVDKVRRALHALHASGPAASTRHSRLLRELEPNTWSDRERSASIKNERKRLSLRFTQSACIDVLGDAHLLKRSLLIPHQIRLHEYVDGGRE